MVNIKYSRFLLSGLVVVLLAFGSCMMPELSPELYVGTLNIDNVGTANINNAGEVIIYGEEYLRISKLPPIIYFTTDDDPGLDWAGAGLGVSLIDKESKEHPVNLAECAFTPVDMTAVGPQSITVSRDGKTVMFSIVVLDKGIAFHGINITRPPEKTAYRRYEAANWNGLIVTEVIYERDIRNPPFERSFTWSDPGISIDHPHNKAFSAIPSGKQIITVTKGSETAFFSVTISGLNWYVEAPPSPGAFDGNNGLSPDAPLPTVQEALNKIKAEYERYSGSWPVSEVAAIAVSGPIISTASSGDMARVEGAYPPILLKGNPGKPGTLDAKRTAASMGRVLYIGPGNTVTLGENLTLTGGFTDSFSYYSSGAGVMVDGNGQNGGVFNMTGGTIKGNTGGSGVFLAESAAFNMSGGTIRDNTIEDDGGGVYADSGSVFTMTGGTICKNTVGTHGGGVYVSGTFAMKNGIISDNTSVKCGGVYVVSGVFEMTGGVITANTCGSINDEFNYYSGGVCVDRHGEFILDGGIISGNSIVGTSQKQGGGGVTVNNGSAFTMKSGIINGNSTVSDGGGVSLIDGAFVMEGGTIRENTAGGNGGGVYVESGATFTKKSSGVITDTNIAATGKVAYIAATSNAINDTDSLKPGTYPPSP
jgi:hypothetical protein